MPELTFDGNIFRFKCIHSERSLPRNAGFSWNTLAREWTTKSIMVAAGLRDYATDEANAQFSRVLITKAPWTLPLPLPPKGLKLLPHQREAALYALGQNRSYLGLDPGLGKTIVAATVATALDRPVVYVTPPFLIENVTTEFERWTDLIVSSPAKAPTNADVMVLPDSMIGRDSVIPGIKKWIGKHAAVCFIDEAHRFKNTTAKRTHALFSILNLFERQVFMSGTPMPNRPMELFPVLSHAAPETINFMNRFEFGRRYCGGKKTHFGWDFTGATNMPELAAQVIHPTGPFMLRQKKALLKLPPKTEETFVVSATMTPSLAKLDRGIGAAYGSIDDLVKHRLADADGKASVDDLHVMTYRRLLGMEKVKPVCQYIEALLAESDESILVFAYHKDVIVKLVETLKPHFPYVITGDTPAVERHKRVEKYQKSKTRRLLIGNYLAAGIGFTMTKATRVIFVEFDWVPGVNEQAGDRAHRIGQDKPVLIQYVVYRDSIDKAVIETLLRKRKAIQYV